MMINLVFVAGRAFSVLISFVNLLGGFFLVRVNNFAPIMMTDFYRLNMIMKYVVDNNSAL